MANNKFDAKSFNPQAFKYIIDRIPNLRMNELRKSKAIVGQSRHPGGPFFSGRHRLCPACHAWSAGRRRGEL